MLRCGEWFHPVGEVAYLARHHFGDALFDSLLGDGFAGWGGFHGGQGEVLDVVRDGAATSVDEPGGGRASAGSTVNRICPLVS